MNQTIRNLTGMEGEKAVFDCLTNLGIKGISRRFKTALGKGAGDIDLLFKVGRKQHLVEVKNWPSHWFILPSTFNDQVLSRFEAGEASLKTHFTQRIAVLIGIPKTRSLTRLLRQNRILGIFCSGIDKLAEAFSVAFRLRAILSPDLNSTCFSQHPTKTPEITSFRQQSTLSSRLILAPLISGVTFGG
jgi:hypothetical protein